MNIHQHILAFASLALLTSIAPLQAAEAVVIPETYPLKTCVISEDAFGGKMGKPIKVTSDGTDVYLCCKMCKKDFDKDPAKYVKMVKDAEATKAK